PDIVMECDSRSTQQNAQRSVPLLRQRGVKRALLVTSWYHSRRALAVFRHAAPDIKFVAVATHYLLSEDSRPTAEAFRYVMIEYVKIAWYYVHHGISPRVETDNRKAEMLKS